VNALPAPAAWVRLAHTSAGSLQPGTPSDEPVRSRLHQPHALPLVGQSHLSGSPTCAVSLAHLLSLERSAQADVAKRAGSHARTHAHAHTNKQRGRVRGMGMAMGMGSGRPAERRVPVCRRAPLTRRRRTTCSTSQSRWCVFVPKSSILEYPMREYPEYPMTAPADMPSNRYLRRAIMPRMPALMPTECPGH
jgi:hypothetical protein